MKILSRKTRSEGTIISDIIVEDETPHIKSKAASILLRNELQLQDVDFLENNLWIWLEFRERYLKKVLTKEKVLKCSYCPKTNLEIGGRSPADLELNNKNPNLATIDHIHPLSKGGKKYDESNLCVACKKCNGKKGNKPLDRFITPLNPRTYKKI